jgi:F0F1-type ATP synthase assembly protein I
LTRKTNNFQLQTALQYKGSTMSSQRTHSTNSRSSQTSNATTFRSPPPPYTHVDRQEYEQTLHEAHSKPHRAAPARSVASTQRTTHPRRAGAHSSKPRGRHHRSAKNVIVDFAVGAVVGSVIGYYIARRMHRRPMSTAIKCACVGGVVGIVAGLQLEKRSNQRDTVKNRGKSDESGIDCTIPSWMFS